MLGHARVQRRGGEGTEQSAWGGQAAKLEWVGAEFLTRVGSDDCRRSSGGGGRESRWLGGRYVAAASRW